MNYSINRISVSFEPNKDSLLYFEKSFALSGLIGSPIQNSGSIFGMLGQPKETDPNVAWSYFCKSDQFFGESENCLHSRVMDKIVELLLKTINVKIMINRYLKMF